MFLIFGFKTKESRTGSRVLPCEICGVTAAQTFFKRTTRLSLFFVPLIPVRRAQHFVQCANCGSVRRADPRMADSIAG